MQNIKQAKQAAKKTLEAAIVEAADLKQSIVEQKKSLKKETESALKNIRKQKTGALLDNVQEKVISRKLLVFAAASGLFIWAGLDADTWGMIAMCYIGGQSAIDFAKTWKGM